MWRKKTSDNLDDIVGPQGQSSGTVNSVKEKREGRGGSGVLFALSLSLSLWAGLCIFQDIFDPGTHPERGTGSVS